MLISGDIVYPLATDITMHTYFFKLSKHCKPCREEFHKLLLQERDHNFVHFITDLEFLAAILIGVSLSEPHTSKTALRMCVCVYLSMLAAIYLNKRI